MANSSHDFVPDFLEEFGDPLWTGIVFYHQDTRHGYLVLGIPYPYRPSSWVVLSRRKRSRSRRAASLARSNCAKLFARASPRVSCVGRGSAPNMWFAAVT